MNFKLRKNLWSTGTFGQLKYLENLCLQSNDAFKINSDDIRFNSLEIIEIYLTPVTQSNKNKF